MAKETNWDKKMNKLKESYPDVKNIDWSKILKDEPDIFRSIVGGVAKSTLPSKNNITQSQGNQKFAQITQSDYSELPFVEALGILWGKSGRNGTTIEYVSQRTGISKEIIYALKRGKREPSFVEMEQIARGFSREPSFFIEYRIGKILAAINVYLLHSPETATAWYKKVSKNSGLTI